MTRKEYRARARTPGAFSLGYGLPCRARVPSRRWSLSYLVASFLLLLPRILAVSLVLAALASLVRYFM